MTGERDARDVPPYKERGGAKWRYLALAFLLGGGALLLAPIFLERSETAPAEQTAP